MLIHKTFSCYKNSHDIGKSSIYHFIVPQLFFIIQHRKLFYTILQKLRNKIISHNKQQCISSKTDKHNMQILKHFYQEIHQREYNKFHHSNSWQVLRNTTELPPACTIHSIYSIPIKHLSNWE